MKNKHGHSTNLYCQLPATKRILMKQRVRVDYIQLNQDKVYRQAPLREQ
jgi:hypothetical protein